MSLFSFLFICIDVLGQMMSGTGSKRASGGDSPPGPPEKKMKKEEKTTTTLIEPIRIGGVSSTVSTHMHSVTVEAHVQIKNQSTCSQLTQAETTLCSAGGNGHEGHPVQEQEAVRVPGAEAGHGRRAEREDREAGEKAGD